MRQLLMLSVATAAFLPASAHAQRTGADKPAAADIVITASPFGSGRDDTPTIVAKVNREQILKSGGASIADSLSQTPGVAATGFASGASRPIIRGMDATRVRILENGSGSSDVSEVGPDHGVPIDPLAARSIEVVRGPATLRYGSQAIGGVVNVINNRIPTVLPTQPIAAEATGSYGTAADVGQGSLLVDTRVGNLALHGDGFYRHADDYDTPLGTQQNSFFRGYGGSVGGSYFFGNSHIGAAVQQYDAKYGIPSDTTFIDMRQTKVSTRSSFDLGSGLLKTLNLDASYANYIHDEKDPDGTILSTFKNKELDSRAELLFGQFGPFQNTALGVEVQHRKFSALGEGASYLFPTKTQSEAAYFFTELALAPKLRLQASGRVEHVADQGTPRSDVFTKVRFTPLSGAVGALYEASDALKLGLTFSSTGRAPAITELFARGPHDGPGTFETGDPTLKIERANSLEGTVRVRTGRFRFEGSVYKSWFHNYIYGNVTGRTCDDDGNCVNGPGEELRELNYRQQGARFWGLEGEASYALIKQRSGTLEAKLLGDYVRAKLSDGSNVPRIPPYRIGGGLNWTSDAVDAGVLFLHYGRQTHFGAFDSPTPGYNELNAQVAWRPFKAYPGIELAIVGQNLTDDVQRDAAALNKDLVVMPGRNIRFVVKVANF
jgi:iron complex outermembrane receptor protein